MARIDELLRKRKRVPPSSTDLDLERFARLQGSKRFARQARKMNYPGPSTPESRVARARRIDVARMSPAPLAEEPAVTKAPPAYAPTTAPTAPVTARQLAAEYFGVKPGMTPDEFAIQQRDEAIAREETAYAPSYVAARQAGLEQKVDIADIEAKEASRQAEFQRGIDAPAAEQLLEAGALDIKQQQGAPPVAPAAEMQANQLFERINSLKTQQATAIEAGDIDTWQGATQELEMAERDYQQVISQLPGAAETAPRYDPGSYTPQVTPPSLTRNAAERQRAEVTQEVGNALSDSRLDNFLGVTPNEATGGIALNPDSPINKLAEMEVTDDETELTLSNFLSNVKVALGQAKNKESRRQIRTLIKETNGYKVISGWIDADKKTSKEQAFGGGYDFYFNQEDYEEIARLARSLVELVK